MVFVVGYTKLVSADYMALLVDYIEFAVNYMALLVDYIEFAVNYMALMVLVADNMTDFVALAADCYTLLADHYT
jgi:hypothetical protein